MALYCLLVVAIVDLRFGLDYQIGQLRISNARACQIFSIITSEQLERCQDQNTKPRPRLYLCFHRFMEGTTNKICSIMVMLKPRNTLKSMLDHIVIPLSFSNAMQAPVINRFRQT